MADTHLISPDTLKDCIRPNETSTPEEAYELTHAELANSGYTVGVFQIDFGSMPTQLNAMMRFLEETGQFTNAELESIREGLKTRANPNALTADEVAKINDALATDEGHAFVDRLDEGQLRDLLDDVEMVLERARGSDLYRENAAYRAFVESDLFQACVGDNANQYGTPNTMARFFGGETVTLGGEEINLNDTEDFFKQYCDYESHYKYARDYPRDMIRRRTNIVNELAEKEILSPEDQQRDLDIIQDAFG